MNVYTSTDWQNDRTLSPKVGQLVADDVIQELMDCVPPRTYTSSIFQVGEAEDHVNGRAVYATFKHTAKGWQYCGLKPGCEL